MENDEAIMNSCDLYFPPGLRKKALRNLWSEALSSENFQLTTNAESSLRPINAQKLIVAFFAVAERNKF